jgi:predicted MPP superfamily phosphohydrolase
VLIPVTLLLLAAAMTVAHLGSFPFLRRNRVRVAIGLVALVLADTVAREVAMRWHAGEEAAVFFAIILIALVLSAIPITLLFTSSWAIARLNRHLAKGRGEAPAREPPPPAAPSLSRRQVVEGAGSIAILGGTSSTLAWGAIRGRHDYRLEEVPVRIAGLPRALDGYAIAQVSDIHTGANMGEHALGEGMDLVRRAKADLLVVTGDLVDYSTSYAPLIARKLADIAPRDGVAVILGNHDHYAGATAVLAAVRAAGLTALVNEGRVMRPNDGGGFALLGVDDLWAKWHFGTGPDLDRALAQVPGHLPRILLSHQPMSVNQWAGRVALQLSGHTHGGQINPGVRPADMFFKYVAGMYQVNGTSLYVNRGFGTVGPPARVGAPPEVTRFVLVAG